MADVIETMYCEIVFRLDGGDPDFLYVCVWDDSRSWYIAFVLVCVPVKVNRFALLFVDLLCYVGRDSRYSEEAPLSVLVVVEWMLIWAISLDAEKQLFRLLSSNVVLFVCAYESCFW